ncbi:MAG: CDP-diacylglycerol--serine O-phosphatidyltransferase [Bacteroidales bacterium]|nr:CDP-diacylglycerol--serine O-phosphatidyltransferase [Bacteroidales bacterium]
MKKYLPSLVTCLNLLCGACACILALWGYFWQAWCFILAGAVFDLCDGALARLLNAVSPMGKELDSLADIVSFGLAPALMLFSWYFKINCEGEPSPLAFVPLLMVAFAAIRLARFNTEDSDASYFSGLATPASAMIASSAVAYGHTCAIAGADSAILALLNSSWPIPVLAAILCVLMVSRIKMFSVKGKIARKHYILAAGALLLVVTLALMAPRGIMFAGYAALFTLLFFCIYILVSLLEQ